MNRETSLYLDLVRVSAALVVFIGHISGQRLTGGFLWQFGPFMDDAVVVFFVLSGFVIAHVVSEREVTVHQYAIARAARMYSVALPALLLTFLLDTLGKWLSPGLYSPAWGYVDTGIGWRILSGMLFINQLWYSNVSIGSLLPYWSLGFEVWYYILFAVLIYARASQRWPIFIGLCCVAGPRIVFLFPLWLSGWFAYRLIKQNVIGWSASCALFSISIVAYVAYSFVGRPVLVTIHIPEIFGDKVLTRYIVALLFLCHLIGYAGISISFERIFKPVETSLRWLAGATFSIYLFHLPIAQFISSILPWAPSSWGTRLVILGGTLATIFLLSEFTERKKRGWVLGITLLYNYVKSRIIHL